MDVIGHHYISIEIDLIGTSNALKSKFEGAGCELGSQKRLAMETTESNEVCLEGLVVTLEPDRHD